MRTQSCDWHRHSIAARASAAWRERTCGGRSRASQLVRHAVRRRRSTGLPVVRGPKGPLITEDEMRAAGARHASSAARRAGWPRSARTATSIGAIPEIQATRAAMRSARSRLRGSSVWVTTERRYVTLQGCAESARVRAKLIERVQRRERRRGGFRSADRRHRQKPRWTVDPAWKRRRRIKKPTRRRRVGGRGAHKGDRRGRAKETTVFRRGSFPRPVQSVQPLRELARVAGRGDIAVVFAHLQRGRALPDHSKK